MENQDQQILAHSSSGHENHEVHVCHKCGWPFPNPHPSAKNRRHHKRVCGTIEGYKLGGVDLEGSSHSNLSDDELIPSPKVLESAGNEQGSGRIRELPNRSEEEVFSDAAAEFSVAGVSATGESALNLEKEKLLIKGSDVIQSIERGPNDEAFKHPESTSNTIGNVSESLGSTSSVASSVADFRAEDSSFLNNSSGNASLDDFKPIKFETQKDLSWECEKNNDFDAVSDGSSTLVEHETVPSQSASETPEALKSLPSISDDDLVHAKIAKTAVSPEVAEGIKKANSDDLTETKGEVNAHVHVLSVPDTINETNNAEVMLEDFKDHNVHLNQVATSGFELTKERDSTEGPVVNVQDSAQSKQSEDTAISASGFHVTHKEAAVEEDSGLSQIDSMINQKQGMEERVAPIDAVKLELDKCGPTGDKSSKGETEGDYKESPVTGLGSAIHDKADVEKVDPAGEARGGVSSHSRSGSGDDNRNSQANEGFLENIGSAKNVSELGSDHEMGITNVRDYEKAEIEKPDITSDAREVATGHANDEIKVNAVVPQSAILLQEHQAVTDDFAFGSLEKLPPSTCADSSSVVVDAISEAKLGVTENDHDKHKKVQEVTPSLGSEDNNGKEGALSSLDAKSSIESSAATKDTSAKEVMGVASGVGSEYFPGESDRQQLGGSIIDFSVDSSSQTDSLENNWGSISALSGISDVQAIVDSESAPTSEAQAVAGGERSNMRKSKPSSEGQNLDKSEMFEPPSFMTLVEPRGEIGQISTGPETQVSQNQQLPSPSALQAGWFPSITNVVNESQGRKKNEEIIAKVTNWSTGKQHTPLKNLLGEASSQDARAKSPKRKENQKGNNNKPTTVNSILAPESPLAQDGGESDVRKEWNSPARYPTEIKREKGKSKSRPYWAQLMCCSSVH